MPETLSSNISIFAFFINPGHLNLNVEESPNARAFDNLVLSYGNIVSGEIIVIFPVYPPYLRFSAQFSPAVPPPMMTKFLLSRGSLAVSFLFFFYYLIPSSGTIT